MAKKVKVTNNVNQYVTLFEKSLNFRMVFERKGVSSLIDLDILQQMIYNVGVEVIFKQGILTIDDMEAKIALGLEPENAKEPVNIITLTENQKRRHMTVSPMNEFKELVDTYHANNLLVNLDVVFNKCKHFLIICCLLIYKILI